ncbi:MAG: cation-translocating P-type ATPase [Mesorhizobium sp.]|uniref:cation-translocating P-type ATPase n=1 Tax=Mesorhizobium sp. TaxID=1871066 RepID=UPI000FE40F9D|nr:cation-translocating P-type ATPase [Mesorhizobium sp.]RWA61980.1 MAG: cation-translocating P-type ATPase [Mesorhizobium sp.]RWB94547.1 MAG: cation-translocating P-type ATPase [Mesorhizobium sp.]RWJ96777.1 MAG: cation-translocating P-type ATPase [Mesorhizobium sp.]RWK24684.1 MAG: cation-translocating P-type ATPase [Mesorhizobium sp.]RWK27271.1 MAG: cation-translocating P-type ATPase [Mesorhizobium sp.]
MPRAAAKHQANEIEPGASTPCGLSEAEARARLLAEGPNELPRSRRRTPLRIAIEVVREPMLALLLGGGAVYLLLGDLREALTLLCFATLSIAITIIQEARTERVLEALRDLTSPRALVVRDSERHRVAGREVVRGDIVMLAEGDRIPADLLLVQSRDLQVDESLLTGESVPVRKAAATSLDRTVKYRPGGDDVPAAFSGSLVVRGSGIGEAVATGARTQIGAIGQALSSLESEAPRLQMQTRRLVRFFAMAGATISALVVLLYGWLRGGWLDGILAGIALGMSMLPEEFPMVLTIFMAMGAWRISQVRVLTRRAAAIEALGSATVLCTDKTGTLTKNQMAVAELRTPDGGVFALLNGSGIVPEAFRDLVELGVLASAEIPFDPMEKAFYELASERLPRRPGTSDRQLVRSYGLRPELLAMSNVWRTGAGNPDCLVAAKGSPEAILKLCRLGADRVVSIRKDADAMAADGLRVLGVARARHAESRLVDEQTGFAFEFVGLVGLADPLRPEVRDAVASCQSAGIRVVMITGDYPATAKAIAREAGLDVADVVTGEELRALSAADLCRVVKTTTVFARIMSDQKLAIVSALKANGEIVAMTGDGVNDAPSLKAADIGIAMGGRGTDVAREASSIVLLDDDFGSIVKTIRLGRRIYDNLRKAMSFIFAVHIPIAGLALMPLLLGLPILFGPIHIAFLEMVIDPVCSLVFEAESEEEDIMERPARDPEEALFTRPLMARSLVQGVLAWAVVAAVFLLGLDWGIPENELRALTFFALVVSIVGLVLVNRAFSASLASALLRPNRALGAVIAIDSTVLGLVLLWPSANALFQFEPPRLSDLAAVLAAAVGLVALLELLKSLGAAHQLKHFAARRNR